MESSNIVRTCFAAALSFPTLARAPLLWQIKHRFRWQPGTGRSQIQLQSGDLGEAWGPTLQHWGEAGIPLYPIVKRAMCLAFKKYRRQCFNNHQNCRQLAGSKFPHACHRSPTFFLSVTNQTYEPRLQDSVEWRTFLFGFILCWV